MGGIGLVSPIYHRPIHEVGEWVGDYRTTYTF
jgi:hypothetical protein